MNYFNPNHPIIKKQSLQFNFHQNHTKFNEKFNLIMEHAIGLFTPGSLLFYIKNKIKDTQFIKLNYDELCKHLSIESHKNFKNAVLKLPKTYNLYILFFDPINEIKYLVECSEKHLIYNEFLKNKALPAARFAFTTKSIIVINSRVCKDDKRFEQLLDHELNHVFKPFLNKNKNELDDLTTSKIDKFIESHFIDDLGISISSVDEFKDYAEHMFGKSEFYEMTADLCNILSLYFNETNPIKLFQKFESMLTKDFINSDQFKSLEEPIKGSLIFAYTCKKFSPKRWKIVIKKVKEQLNLNNLSGSIKIFLNKLKENFKRIK